METTYYSGVTLNGVYTLTGRPNTVKTTAVAPSPYGTDFAPDKVYTYVTNTPIVASELLDANRNGSFESSGASLDLKTTYTRDARGRVTATEIWGNETVGDYYVGKFDTSKVTSYDDRFDLPLISKNAFDDETRTEYHDLFGLPVSVEDSENGAEVTSEYDALGRAILVTDELKDLETTTEFAWTPSTTSDWKSQQPVVPPGGISGTLTQYSVYAVHTTATVQPAVTEYFDRLGRTIRTVKEGFAGQKTYADTIYDSLGRVVATSNPYLEGATKYWTKTTYDPFGRVATVTSPNGTVTENTYKGRVTQVEADAPDKGGVDPAPQINTTLVDARGATIKVWNPDNVPGTLSIDGTGMTDPSITYELDGFGRMRATILKGQSEEITATYDVLGRQLTLDDPDKGNWSYVNNALGQVKKQTDAKNNVTTSTFDRLGRPLKRITTEPSSGPVETAEWFYYDSSPVSGMNHVPLGNKGWNGAPQRETSYTTGAPGYQAPPSTTIHYYDDKGRNHIDLATVDDKWFYTYADYDAYSRVKNIRHYWRPALHEAPSDLPYLWHNFGYTYTYDAESYLLQIADTAERTWWEADTANGYDYLDRPVLVRKGAGHWTRQTYDPTDQLLTGIDTGTKSGGGVTPVVQNLDFIWDGLGNLTGRDDVLHSLSEDFTYDILNRVTHRKLGAGSNTVIATYDGLGNITGKRDVTNTWNTNYAYGAGAAGPHAATTAWGYTMTYDDNGNLATKTGNGQTWTTRWAGFDKPRWLAKDNKGSEFVYNAARQRVIHLEFDAMIGNEPLHYTHKKLYALGTDLEVDYRNAASSGEDWQLDTVRIYVPGPGGKIGTMEFEPFAPFQNAEKEYVYHRDHLGSIESITEHGDTSASYALDDAGKPSRYSYDPWGERRDPTDWDGAPTTATTNGGKDDLTPRGFTSHEMLDELGLVHMNGRIYDGQIGRFLSADIIVQFPDRLQSFNRYSYVRNNPLTYTDPSGYAEKKLTEEELQKLQKEKRNEVNRMVNGESAADRITGGSGTGAGNVASNAANGAAGAVEPSDRSGENDTGGVMGQPADGTLNSTTTNPNKEDGSIEDEETRPKSRIAFVNSRQWKRDPEVRRLAKTYVEKGIVDRIEPVDDIEMVESILRGESETRSVTRVVIVSHGNDGIQVLGTQQLTLENFSFVGNYIASRGECVFGGCSVANTIGVDYLKDFAKETGVTFIGNTTDANLVYGHSIWNERVSAVPDGDDVSVSSVWDPFWPDF